MAPDARPRVRPSTRALSAVALAWLGPLASCAGSAHEGALLAPAPVRPSPFALAPARAAEAQYPLTPTAAPHADAVLSGGLLLRGRAQRFAHPAGGSVVRIALAVTNAGPAARTVIPAGFTLGAALPWLVGQRFSDVLVAPGQTVVGVLAFRAPNEPLETAHTEVSLRYPERATSPEPALVLHAAPLEVPATAVRALEGLASARALNASALDSTSVPRAPAGLAVTVDAATVVQRTGYYDSGWFLAVTVTAVNFTGAPLAFRASELRVSSDELTGSTGPAVVPEALLEANPVRPMGYATGLFSWRLQGPPAHDIDLRVTYGPLGKFSLDAVYTATAPLPLRPASPSVLPSALAPGTHASLTPTASAPSLGAPSLASPASFSWSGTLMR